MLFFSAQIEDKWDTCRYQMTYSLLNPIDPTLKENTLSDKACNQQKLYRIKKNYGIGSHPDVENTQ